MSGATWAQDMNGKFSTEAELEVASGANELLQDRIVEAIGDAVQEAIRDHKRAGNPIAGWRDGRVVVVPPDQIED
jgi:hypothetical protein